MREDIKETGELYSMSVFKGKTLMITGGTGSFGNTVLKHFLDSDIGEIRIFSRDEKKQDDMRHHLQAQNPETAKKVKFYIGDVRNIQSVRDAMDASRLLGDDWPLRAFYGGKVR